MTALPLAYEDEFWAGQEPGPDGCPITASGIVDYLVVNRDAYLRDDFEFDVPIYEQRRDEPDMTLWLWSSDDTHGREWFIVVATEAKDVSPKRWMHAMTNEDAWSADEMFEFALSERRYKP